MDINVVLQVIADVTGRKWMPLAILVIGYLVTLTNDTSKLPINIPARWQPVLVVVLGETVTVLTSIESGTRIEPAIIHGLVISFSTMGLFDLLVKGIFNGTLPSWLGWLLLVDPNLADAKKKGILPAQPVVGHKIPSVPPPPLPPPTIKPVA